MSGKVSEDDFDLLKCWVSGFQSNVPKDSPYILLEEYREYLFPDSNLGIAVSEDVANLVAATWEGW